jgi:hypothetical protein
MMDYASTAREAAETPAGVSNAPGFRSVAYEQSHDARCRMGKRDCADRCSENFEIREFARLTARLTLLRLGRPRTRSSG